MSGSVILKRFFIFLEGVKQNKTTIMYLTIMKARPPATRTTNNVPPTAATITIHSSAVRTSHVKILNNNIT